MIDTLQIGLRWSSRVSGGADRVFEDLAKTMPAAGVRFIGAVAGPADLDIATDGLVHSFAFEDARTIMRLRGAYITLTRLLDEKKPDLVASHFALYVAPILHRLSERPFVMHFHGPWAFESEVEGGLRPIIFAKHKLEQSVYGRADRLIVLSQAFATLLHRDYGVREDKIRIVPGAVNLDRFAPVYSRAVARELLQWPNNRPILFSVRRLVSRMGLDQLIEAMASIRKQVPDVLLFIGGTGPMRKILEHQVRELSLEENIRFLGFLPEEALPLAYRAADVSVVPTAALEGFGLVAAESLAAGTPAMVTPVGGLPEVVKALSESLIVSSGSPADLAQALTAALLGKIRLPTDDECREYAVANFSRHLMALRVADVYREVLI